MLEKKPPANPSRSVDAPGTRSGGHNGPIHRRTTMRPPPAETAQVKEPAQDDNSSELGYLLHLKCSTAP